MKNIVPTSKNSASDGGVWAREIKEIKHWNPPCLQHLWESPTLCTSVVISEFPSGLPLIDKLQWPWTTLLEFKGWILNKKLKWWNQRRNPRVRNVYMNTQEWREENWMGSTVSKATQDARSEQPRWQGDLSKIHRVPKPRQPENNLQWEDGKRCFRGAEALIYSQAPPASLRNLG